MSTRTRQFSTRGLVVLLSAANLALGGSGCQGGAGTPSPTRSRDSQSSIQMVEVTPTPFGERNEEKGDVYNTSGIVQIADGHFLVVDNNTNDALLDLRLTPDGKQATPLALVPLEGLPAKVADDLEDLAIVEEGGRQFVVAMPSLSVKPGSKRRGKEQKVRPSGLLRIEVRGDGTLAADAMPGFRDWIIQTSPDLAVAADNEPDLGGLNIEGLGWDPERHALLLGIRTPVVGNAPIVVPVRVKDVAGPWNEENLEVLPLVKLQVEPALGAQGVRGMSPGPDGRGFLITVANATSDDEAPFALYHWDGNQEGIVRRLPVTFAKKMKPEGLTVGTVGGRAAIVFVDDAGGVAVLWLDELPEVAASLQTVRRGNGTSRYLFCAAA
jgi:hypothetical protein